MVGTIRFRTREACPVCGGTDGQALWQGRLSDPDVQVWLGQFQYSGDATGLDQPFALWRCAGCGMGFHRNIPDEDGLATLYGQWADAAQAARFEVAHLPPAAEADVDRRLKIALRLRHLARQTQPDGPLRLLDFGCGAGAGLLAARALGFQAFGVEMSESRAAQARSCGATVCPDLAQVEVAAGGSFHAVVLDQVLEHLPDPLALLRRVSGAMRPGAVLFLAVPDCSGLTVPRDFDQFHRLQPLEHLNAFTPATLDRIATAAGFVPQPAPPAFLTTRPLRALRAMAALLRNPAPTDRFYSLPP